MSTCGKKKIAGFIAIECLILGFGWITSHWNVNFAIWFFVPAFILFLCGAYAEGRWVSVDGDIAIQCSLCFFCSLLMSFLLMSNLGSNFDRPILTWMSVFMVSFANIFDIIVLFKWRGLHRQRKENLRIDQQISDQISELAFLYPRQSSEEANRRFIHDLRQAWQGIGIEDGIGPILRQQRIENEEKEIQRLIKLKDDALIKKAECAELRKIELERIKVADAIGDVEI